MKKEIIAYLSQSHNQNNIHTVKKENSYLSISTPTIRLLDISNYLTPGCSCAQFLKAYGCDIPKEIFPYEWFDS